MQWGSPFDVDTQRAREEFNRLAKGTRESWQLAQLEAKLRIFEAHADVSEATDWDQERLDAAERFFAEREKLQRQVWGLGPVRGVVNERYYQPDWFEEWELHRRHNQAPSSERRLSESD